MNWYLRSTADQDTHRASGVRSDGTVAAECGLEFAPRPLPFNRVALPGHPRTVTSSAWTVTESRQRDDRSHQRRGV